MRWNIWDALEFLVDAFSVLLLLAMVGFFSWLGVIGWMAAGPLYGSVALLAPAVLVLVCLGVGWQALRRRLYL